MVIVIQCEDRVGLVANITAIIAGVGLNIVSMREFVDETNNRFFMRLDVTTVFDTEKLKEQLQHSLPADAVISINAPTLKKVVVMVTKEYHCLADILIRNYFDTLGAQVMAVIGNHDTLRDICNRFEVPFFKLSHDDLEKAAFEHQLITLLQRFTPDYIVLAKFMRIISPALVAKYGGRIINIHHSFLPAFAGARPYKQAFDRGVKLIGATAHFVTEQLDEGPIITQEIIPVNHSFTVTDMVKAGKEIETAVLARALKLVFEDRIFVYDNKTVVFE